jgi:Tol biopolymer transport system component
MLTVLGVLGAVFVAAEIFIMTSTSSLTAPDETTLVSVGSSGEQGNAGSYWASMSADGRFVAFGSWADNLVPGDTNGVMDIFVRDRKQGTTERVSVNSAEVQQNDNTDANHEILCGLDISADGRYVAFSSAADNLVPDDTNDSCDVFVRDRKEGTTERVSVHDSGEQAGGSSEYPSISEDGRYVAFATGHDDLVGDGSSERNDVYVRDLWEGTIQRVSVNSSDEPISGNSGEAFISADGRYVSFTTDGINLVPNDDNNPDSLDILVRDLWEGTTRKASVSSSGDQGNAHSSYSSISTDGRYVTFSSFADNLVTEDTNGEWDVFLRDLQEGTTRRVSIASSGEQANSYSEYPSISADGRVVVFESTASNLVPDSNGGMPSVYVRDLREATTRKVSVSSSGEQANREAFNAFPSADGRYVVFSSYADNLVTEDTNEGSGADGTGADVFVRGRPTQDGTNSDTTAPTATVVTPPDGAVYVRDQKVRAKYHCKDETGGSGIESCTGTVPRGRFIDTASLGEKTFTVRATDEAGNETSVTTTYRVVECRVTGTPGDDVLEGTEGDDRICGLGGDDTLKGLGGNDELVGGAGDDTLDGGTGTDVALFDASPAGVTASLVTGESTGDGSDSMTGTEGLTGSEHNDTLIGSGSANSLSGGGGTDQLFGLEDADTLLGGPQDDALRGGAGDDQVGGNEGSDDLLGEEGDDSLNSGDGVEGNDALNGGTGTDECSTDRTEESKVSCER